MSHFSPVSPTGRQKGPSMMTKDCIIQDRKAHEKCEAYTLVMKIEKGAEWRQKHCLSTPGFIIKIKDNIIFIN